MGGLVRLAALLAGAAPVALALASGGGDGGGGVPASDEDQIRRLTEGGVKYVRQHRLSDIYASANVVTMWSSTWPVFNLPPPQKHVEGAYFVKEDGKWHLVPQPGTSGCDTTSSQDVPPIPPE